MTIRIYVNEWYADCKKATEYYTRKSRLALELDRIVGPDKWCWGLQTILLNVPKCVYIEDSSDLLVLKLKGFFTDGEYPMVHEKRP